MMKQLLFGVILFCCAVVKGQQNTTWEQQLRTYPKELTAKRLAAKILKDFSTDEERAKAVFYWIANTITYNLSAEQQDKNKHIAFYYQDEKDKKRKIRRIKDSIVRETMLSRKANCEGYAQTLAKIYTHLGLENRVVKGYVRNSIYDIGNIEDIPNHAWNLVKINKEWKIVDATWAAGSVINGRWQQSYNDYYYDIPKKHYAKTHFSENRKWQFGEWLTKEAFYKQPIYSTEFLRTNLELIEPMQGEIVMGKTSNLTLKIKNLSPMHKVLYGVSTNRYAQKPMLRYESDLGYVTVQIQNGSNRLFLVIDGKVQVEFKLI